MRLRQRTRRVRRAPSRYDFHGKKQPGGRKGVKNDAFSSAEH
jgi:hypothetical protein